MKAAKVILKFIPAIYVHSDEYVRQFSLKLGIPREFITKMEMVCKEIDNWAIFGSHSPKQRTIASAVIYLFSDITEHKRSLAEIKDAANIATDHTIRKYYNILLEKKDILLSRALKDEENGNQINATEHR